MPGADIALDLGVGSDDYKRLFCKGDEPIFDCFIPLSPRGGRRGRDVGINRAKHLVKHIRRCCRWRRTAKRVAKWRVTPPSGRHDPRAGIDGIRRQRRLAQHRHLGEADRLQLIAHQGAGIVGHRCIRHHHCAGLRVNSSAGRSEAVPASSNT